MSRVIAAFSQFFDGAGDPLINGWLEFLVTETNNSKKNTYSDVTLTLPNSNPLQLDAEGRCLSVFGFGSYKVKLYDNNLSGGGVPGALIQEFDYVSAAGESSGGGGSGNFGEWDTNITYAVGDVVVRNLVYYQSFVADNLNYDPEANADKWEVLEFQRPWNSAVTYADSVQVTYDGQIYFSLQAANVNHQPDTSPSWWENLSGFSYWNELSTALIPVASGYNLGATTNLIGTIYQNTDSRHFFGGSQEGYIVHSGTIFYLRNTVGSLQIGNLSATGVIYFLTNSLNRWTIEADGHFLPSDTTSYNIGSYTKRVNHIYQGTDSIHYFGDSNESHIHQATTDDAFIIRSTAGAIQLSTEAADPIYLITTDIIRWTVEANGHFLPYETNDYDIGSTTKRVRHTYQRSEGYHYFGDSQEAFHFLDSGGTFYFRTSSGSIQIRTDSAYHIYFATVGTARWAVMSDGDFLPYRTDYYDIGSTTKRVQTIYAIDDLDYTSDYRLKENIKTSDLGLDFISQLNPVKFTLKGRENERTRYGLIAQEVNSVLSSLGMKYDDFCGVRYDEDEDIWSMGYTTFIAPMIKAIQELKQEVENLKNG